MDKNNTKRSSSIPGYLYPLDGIRGIATLLIFFFHLWQQSWITYYIRSGSNTVLISFEKLQRYGYFALDIFFVLSGFCLFYPVARAMFGESKETSLKTFYLKRARRIWPSYLILLLILAIFPVFSWAVPPASDIKGNLWHYLSHALFIHNFWPETVSSTLSTAWTMPIEVQFYLIFPLVCYFFKKSPVITFISMFIMTQSLRLHLCAMYDLTAYNQSFTFYYLDIFAWGMLSAYFVVYVRNKLKHIDKLAPIMTLISLACVYIIWQFIGWLSTTGSLEQHFRMVYRFILCGATAMLIFSSCYSVKLWQKRILGNKFLVFISTISYTFYLCHQNINIFLRRANIPYSAQNPVMTDRVAMDGFSVLSIVLSLIVAVVLTYLVDLPIAKYGYKEYFKRIPKVFKEKFKGLKEELSLPR